MPRQVLSGILSTIAIVLLATGAAPIAAARTTPHNVLIIHWGAEDFPGTHALEAAIREAGSGSESGPVNYYAEYLETEIFPAGAASLALRDYIRKKYEGRRLDVVIANTTPALEFALAHREELFPAVPIVFVARRMPAAFSGKALSGVTGVVSEVSFAETLELALQLHPTVQQVFVVAQAPAIAGYHESVQAALQPFSQRVRLTYIWERSIPDLLAAVSAIPAGSLILYTRYQPEEADRLTYTDAVARLMADAAAVPIYAPIDLYMGTGVVGGMMRGNRTTGTRIGEIVRRILDGTPPEQIPIERVKVVPTFDWRQLQRWNIDLSRLPPGSTIQFRTPTLWESHRWYIIGTIAFVAALLLLIAGLLAQRARTRRAEATLRTSESTLRQSYERIRLLAGRLISAQEAARANLARDLHDDFCQELVYLSMGVSGLKNSSGKVQDAQTQQRFSELEQETLAMFEGMRRLSHELHPPSLRLLGLAPALRAHCNEIAKRHNVEVRFRSERPRESMHPDVALCLFRIAQEALRNGIVHGKGQHFAVRLSRSGSLVELSVTDDGRGFDLEAARRDASGLGLVSMEERAHLVGGNVQVFTAPGQGTTILVQVPADMLEHLEPQADVGQTQPFHRPVTIPPPF